VISHSICWSFFPLEKDNRRGLSLLYIFERDAPEGAGFVTLWLSVLWESDISPKEYLSRSIVVWALTTHLLKVY
jgi:hypothetical protein